MPDITMCGDVTCPLRDTCYRNPASGTVPDPYRQSFFYTKKLWSKRKLKTATATGEAIMCPYYWRASPRAAESFAEPQESTTVPSVDFVRLEERN
jgi:hypothetical protein